MNERELHAAHQAQVEALRARAAHVQDPLLAAAKDVAITVKKLAARNGHSLNIRVVKKSGGVRITVVGARAERYRAIVGSELARRAPGAQAEIRAQLSGRH